MSLYRLTDLPNRTTAELENRVVALEYALDKTWMTRDGRERFRSELLELVDELSARADREDPSERNSPAGW